MHRPCLLAFLAVRFNSGGTRVGSRLFGTIWSSNGDKSLSRIVASVALWLRSSAFLDHREPARSVSSPPRTVPRALQKLPQRHSMICARLPGLVFCSIVDLPITMRSSAILLAAAAVTLASASPLRPTPLWKRQFASSASGAASATPVPLPSPIPSPNATIPGRNNSALWDWTTDKMRE